MSSVPTTDASRRPVVAACIGNAIEWYDFAVYGFVAVYIGAQFFPNESQSVELLSSFAVFGLTFLVRPLGGLVMGSISDRVGRKNVLVFVLLLMASATVGIGLLPTYSAIGVAAPALLVLLRCVQGFSAGGEYGSVTSFVIEHAAPGRRGRATSYIMQSCVLGFIVGASVATGLVVVLSDESMMSWGWRVPFVIAGPLGVIGLYIRLKLEETPEFQALQERDRVAHAPLRDVFSHPRQLAASFGIGAFHAGAFYFVMTFMTTFVSVTLGRGSMTAFLAAVLSGLVAAAVMPTLGGLSDRIGRRPTLFTAAIGFLLLPYPLLMVIRDASGTGAVLAQCGLGLLLGILISTSIVSMTEIFPARVRASAGAVGYNIPAALFGGTAPFIGVWLVESTGSILAPAYYLMALAVVGLAAIMILPPPVPFAADAAPVETDEETSRVEI